MDTDKPDIEKQNNWMPESGSMKNSSKQTKTEGIVKEVTFTQGNVHPSNLELHFTASGNKFVGTIKSMFCYQYLFWY